jgi:hypothetical protein
VNATSNGICAYFHSTERDVADAHDGVHWLDVEIDEAMRGIVYVERSVK